MKSVDWSRVTEFAESGITEFHHKRVERLRQLKLNDVLKRKNPYLFRAKNILTAEMLVRSVLDAHLSSQEETLFGDFLEELAIHICGQAFDGRKSAARGIDLEFDRDGIRYIVSIKSGPHWGNSSQIAKMRDNFRSAAKILHTGNSRLHVQAINGCCYGRDSQPEKGDYRKLCGQRFWEFVSGDEELYTRLIEPIGYRAKEKTSEFDRNYASVVNLCSQEFLSTFCSAGCIDWNRLLAFNSAKEI